MDKDYWARALAVVGLTVSLVVAYLQFREVREVRGTLTSIDVDSGEARLSFLLRNDGTRAEAIIGALLLTRHGEDPGDLVGSAWLAREDPILLAPRDIAHAPIRIAPADVDCPDGNWRVEFVFQMMQEPGVKVEPLPLFEIDCAGATRSFRKVDLPRVAGFTVVRETRLPLQYIAYGAIAVGGLAMGAGWSGGVARIRSPPNP